MSERPLRVAIFGESYLPYLSGVTVATEALARGLDAAGQHALLVVPRPATGARPGSASLDPRGPSPDVAWLPSFQVPGPAPLAYRVPVPIPSEALRRVTAFAPQIIHAQSPFVSGLMARRTARRLQVPLVFTHHTRFGDYRHYLGPGAEVGGRLLETWLHRFWLGCSAVVAPGAELADEIRGSLGPRRRPLVTTIATGIETSAIEALDAADPRQQAGWPDDSVVVAALGRLAPEKSPELVLEAFALVAAELPAARLLVIGAGPSEGSLRGRAGLPDLAGRVHFAGMRPRRDALALLKGSDLFVGASRTETQGLVLNEALACGLPVVALDGPGVADAVRDGTDGKVVAAGPGVGRADRLADAIRGLLVDERERSRMAAAALAGAGRFSAETRIGAMVALYRALLASGD
jgi:1,2-diacylglycerol 3-alpha-glucosyltransferase